MSADRSHLDALNLRLSHERERLGVAKTVGEVTVRLAWVHGIEREIAAELEFLGQQAGELPDLGDDELLAALK